jgi:hypothetical protein
LDYEQDYHKLAKRYREKELFLSLLLSDKLQVLYGKKQEKSLSNFWELLNVHVDDNRHFSLADSRSAWTHDHKVLDTYPEEYINHGGPIPVKIAGPNLKQPEHYWEKDEYIYGSIAARAVRSRFLDVLLPLIDRWESTSSIMSAPTTRANTPTPEFSTPIE